MGERRRIFTILFIIIKKKKKNKSIIPYYIHTHTHTHTHIHEEEGLSWNIYIYIYIYFVLYLFMNRYYTILYSNIIKKEKQTNKEHTIILSRRSVHIVVLGPFHSVGTMSGNIFIIFGTKKKAGEEYDMTTGTKERTKRTASTRVLFIIIY